MHLRLCRQVGGFEPDTRYSTDDDTFFTDPGKKIGVRRWQTNFIPDTRTFKLESWKERGAGGSNPATC